MEILFNNKFNILLLIILKNSTNWSAACNFESFRNTVDFDAGQMFISTWNEINFIRCCTRWGNRIGTNPERVAVKLFYLEQDISVNLIRYIDLFLDVILPLDELLRWSFQAVDCLLGWTFWFLFLINRTSFYISSKTIGKVVVSYWVASMGWWIQNSNL